MELPTVKIQDGDGDYIVINESDFDKRKHKLFVEKEENGNSEPEQDKKEDK